MVEPNSFNGQFEGIVAAGLKPRLSEARELSSPQRSANR